MPVAVVITVDTNSGEDAVWDRLQQLSRQPTASARDVTLRRGRLDVGDFLVEQSRSVHDGDAGDGDGGDGGDGNKGDQSQTSRGQISRVCIERKTWTDLQSSFGDGRWSEQRARMLDDGTRYVYALEGGSVRPWDQASDGRTWSAVTKVALRDDMVFLPTRGANDTAALVWYVARQLQSSAFDDSKRKDRGATLAAAHARRAVQKAVATRPRDNFRSQCQLVQHKRKRDPPPIKRDEDAEAMSVVSAAAQEEANENRNGMPSPSAPPLEESPPSSVSMTLCTMLSVVPGMSVARSEAVLTAFGSAKALCVARPSELADVRCGGRRIGPKLAEAIKAVFSD